MHPIRCLALAVGFALPALVHGQNVTAPPEELFAQMRADDRQAARTFYKKYLDIKGMPVLAAAEVADEALWRTCEIVTHMLAGRPDVLDIMVKHGTRLIIIGKG